MGLATNVHGDEVSSAHDNPIVTASAAWQSTPGKVMDCFTSFAMTALFHGESTKGCSPHRAETPDKVRETALAHRLVHPQFKALAKYGCSGTPLARRGERGGGEWGQRSLSCATVITQVEMEGRTLYKSTIFGFLDFETIEKWSKLP